MPDFNFAPRQDRSGQNTGCTHVLRPLRPLIRSSFACRSFHPRWLVVAVISLVFCAIPVASGEIIPAHDHVARLNHAGFKSRAHCTAFLSAAGDVVTAAHCVPDVPEDTVHILLRYELGKMAHHLKAPGKAYRRMPQRDLAVMCGHRPPGSGLALETSDPVKGTDVLVRGYGAPKVHVLQERTCALSEIFSGGMAALDCPLPAGTSGAPVMDAQSEKVIGVVSSSGTNRSLIGVLEPGILQSLCAD